MKTSHINHLVLYAKNFYRHTGNVIKDCQRFMQMDGHPWKKINTPEKVWNVMRKDFLEWAESIPKDNYDSHLVNDADSVVAWANGVEAHIYHILIVYEIYIPMTGAQLGYPKYDQYHMPQFGVRENLFDPNGTFEDWNKAAKDFLDTSLEDRCDEYMNQLMDKYPFEDLAKIYNALHDEVTEDQLKDELWNLYTEFMDENTVGDGTVTLGNFTKYSEHFILDIRTKASAPGFDVHAIFTKATYTVPGECTKENLEKLYDMAIHDEQFIWDRIEISKKINELFPDNYDYTFNENQLDYGWIQDIIVEHKNNMVNNEHGGFDYLLKNKHTCGGSGYFELNTEIKDDHIKLTVIFHAIFACTAMERKLWNPGVCIDDKKY